MHEAQQDGGCGCAAYYLARWPDISADEAVVTHRGGCAVDWARRVRYGSVRGRPTPLHLLLHSPPLGLADSASHDQPEGVVMARIGREEEPITVVPDDPETVPTVPEVDPEREPAPASP